MSECDTAQTSEISFICIEIKFDLGKPNVDDQIDNKIENEALHTFEVRRIQISFHRISAQRSKKCNKEELFLIPSFAHSWPLFIVESKATRVEFIFLHFLEVTRSFISFYESEIVRRNICSVLTDSPFTSGNGDSHIVYHLIIHRRCICELRLHCIVEYLETKNSNKKKARQKYSIYSLTLMDGVQSIIRAGANTVAKIHRDEPYRILEEIKTRRK